MPDEGQTTREQVGDSYEAAAAELERAAAHLRTAARHIREGEVPRGCAHAWAAHRHMRTATTQLDDNAIAHAARSEP